MSTWIQTSLSVAGLLLEAILVGICVVGGMWLVSSIVLTLFEKFGR